MKSDLHLKFHKKILITIIRIFFALSILNVNVSAKEKSNESFCSNPVQRICGDTSSQRIERKSYINKLKKLISNESKINSRNRIAKMKINPIHIILTEVLKTQNFIDLIYLLVTKK